MPDFHNHRTTERILDILETVCDSPDGYTLSALCKLLSLPKSSMFPLLHTLRERGYLLCDKGTQVYRMGPMAFHVGSRYVSQNGIMEKIGQAMNVVVEECGETCHFGTLLNGEVLYLKKADSPQTVRMTSTVGHTLPAYATGIGKALLTDYDLPALKKLYPDGLVPLTPHTVTDFEALARQCEESRCTGFSYESEESDLSIRCVAVPVRKNGSVAAAYSVAVPVYRYNEALAEKIRNALQTAKRDTEALLAHTELPF